jgi:hypothetical protein
MTENPQTPDLKITLNPRKGFSHLLTTVYPVFAFYNATILDHLSAERGVHSIAYIWSEDLKVEFLLFQTGRRKTSWTH